MSVPVTVPMPEPLVEDLDGAPYPHGWQPSLGRVRDAETEEDAIIEALVVAWTAPRAMGDKYMAALTATLLTRLARPIPGVPS
jgi:hypothetical protein